MTSRYIDDESLLVAMCRALNNCPDLDNPLLRTICYVDADIDTDWRFDSEAVRRQLTRRSQLVGA